MQTIRGLLRLLHLIAHIIKGLFLSYTKLHGTESHDLSDEQHDIILSWLHRSAEIVGLDIHVSGTPSPAPAFVVSNHISWIDILIIASVLPVSFLSKEGVRRWPVVGLLAAKAGTLFIKRGAKNGAAEAINLMKTKLLAGHSVACFPEAKTTDGTSVHRFHARLFAAAIETGSMVQPVALCYPLDGKVNPIVPYLDEPNLIKHGFRIMCTKKTHVEVTLCKPIATKDSLRDDVANAAQTSITRVVNTSV